jgi:hypothetical protein
MRLSRPPVPAAVFVVALVVRIAFAIDVRGEPLFSILAVDARSYFELASRFASGDWFYGREALWFAPLYPTALGALFRAVGPEVAVARAIQFLLGAGTAALGAALAGRVSRRAGAVAGGLLALSPVAIFYEGQLLYTSLAVFLTALFLQCLLRVPGAGSAGSPKRAGPSKTAGPSTGGRRAAGLRRAAGAGLVLGVLGLVRSNALLFLPLGALWLARGKGGASRAAAFTLAALCALAPVLLRNGLVAGEWTPMTVNGGMIFATGFNDESLGGRALLRSPDDFGPHGAFHREASRGMGREVTLAEASGYHRDRAVAWIRSHPGETLRLTARKLALLATREEIDDNLGFDLVRPSSRVLHWLPVSWPWFVIPGVFGAVAGWRLRGSSGQMVRILVLYSAVYCGSLLMFFVNARYRLPLAVPLAVLAGVGVESAAVAWRHRTVRALAAPAAAAALIAVFAFRSPGVRADPALSLVAVSAALERDGRHEDALVLGDRAIALNPSVAGAHQNRAVSLLALERPEEALAAAEQAVRLDPDLSQAWLTVGALNARAGRFDRAAGAFRRATELSPQSAPAWDNLARSLAALGDFQGALGAAGRGEALGSGALRDLRPEWTRRAAEKSAGSRNVGP